MTTLLAAADPALGGIRAGWLIEVIGPIIAIVAAAFLVRQTLRTRQLSVAALMFIGTTTMFWQEFYADWGCFLYYNSGFVDIPFWGHTPYTTPNKPLFVIFGYGWFFAGSFPALLAILTRLKATRPQVPLWLLSALVVGPLFWLWNLLTADGAAFFGHWWRYMQTYGPATTTDQGNLPYLFAAIPFAFFAVATMVLLVHVSEDGRRAFERLARLSAHGSGFAWNLRRAAIWSLFMNLCYGGFFVLPLVLVRVFFFSPNAIVP